MLMEKNSVVKDRSDLYYIYHQEAKYINPITCTFNNVIKSNQANIPTH